MPGADPDDVRELLNYRDAFEFVPGWLDSGEPITEGLVRETATDAWSKASAAVPPGRESTGASGTTS